MERPGWAIAALSLCHAAQYYSVVSVYSYIGYLAEHNGWTSSVSRAGFISGFIGSAMPLARLFTAMIWGRVADSWGRKPVIIIGMASVAVGHLVFAFAQPLWLAVAARFVLMGALNGWPSLTGLVAQEVAGPQRVHEALGRIYGAAGVVCLVAPACGAALYGRGPFGERYPASAPSLVPCVASVCAALGVWLLVPETLPSLIECPGSTRTASSTSASSDSEQAIWSGLLRRRPLPMLIALRTTMGFVEFGGNDITPLYLCADVRFGGLGLSVQQLGVVMLTGSSIVTTYSLTLLGALTPRIGLPGSVVFGALLMAVGMMLQPLFRTIDNYSVWPRPLLVALPETLSGLGFMHCFTALVAAFNAAVNRHAAQRGALNGLATSCMAAAMAAGPLIASPAFAASVHAFPPTSTTQQPPRSLPWQAALHDGVSLVLGALVLLLLGVASVGGLYWQDLDSLQASAQSSEAGDSPPAPLDGSVTARAGSRRERLLPSHLHESSPEELPAINTVLCNEPRPLARLDWRAGSAGGA
eukprot:CAMPEP_0115851686 /NCGR_PEP_ID=MMETSP0287-20121206/12609_1 /TAXON_ID=412157 /ORGANISM="Chrysochromulina rotalis, Strain UIO044" /LENGTH=527 /DNA_ID=CAMNT_0003305725 /DNA_START=12 /DNA_END=1595 /DNA_ORIENTATION=-